MNSGFYSKKKCLVTGGTGLIGRKVAFVLRSMGASLINISLDNIVFPWGDSHHYDLRYFDQCLKATQQMDYVFHLAGVKTSPSMTESRPASLSVAMLMINTNMFEACRINKVKKTLYTSSIGAYEFAELLKEENAWKGQPMDFYPGWVKRMGEFQVSAYEKEDKNNRFITVRLGAVYGEGDNFDPDTAMVIPALMAKIKRGDNPVMVWGDGSAIRDITYSSDIAMGIVQTMMCPEAKGIINLGSGIGYSIKEIIEALRSFIEFNYEFDTTKPAGAPRRVVDISLAQKLFDYNPSTSLIDGLKKTWNWFINHADEYKLRKNYFKEDK